MVFLFLLIFSFFLWPSCTGSSETATTSELVTISETPEVTKENQNLPGSTVEEGSEEKIEAPIPFTHGVSDIVDLVRPAVVSIATEITIDDPFFGNRASVQSGTGFFINPQGNVVTNHHVIDGCNAVKVSFKGDEIEAKVLAIDKMNDLAIIIAKIKPNKVYPVSGEDVALLEDVIIAGFP